MSSAFVRSLRGADTPKPAEARKKKSVRWDDGEADDQSLGGEGNSRGNSSNSEGILQANTGANVGTSAASLTSIQEQGIDHLRVPATRTTGAGRVDSARNHTSFSAAAAASSSAVGTSARKRVGDQNRGIQGGAVRVRTPAKPKRVLRQDATPHPSTLSTGAAAVGRATPHNYLRRGGIAGPTTSPNKSSPTRRTNRPGQTISAMSPTRASSLSRLASPTKASLSRVARPRQEAAATAAVTAAPSLLRSPASSSPRPARQAKASPRRRLSSAGQALRNVAGGNADDCGSLEVLADEDDVSQLSSSISGGSRASGRPPRSPRANISLKDCGSPLADVSPRARASPRSVPVLRMPSPHRFFPCDSVLEDDGLDGEEFQEDDDEDDDEFHPSVTRQSLESRLAAASAAGSSFASSSHRTSIDNLHNAARQSSPYAGGTTTSTTVRRRSTSLIQVTGEPSSFLSEEVSEESSSVTVSGGCSCQHDDGCAIGSLGGQLQAPSENSGSVEVADRLEELQGRNSTLEQEKVNLTLALVPLEERLEAKERAWEAERRDLTRKAEEGRRHARVAEERSRELDKRRSEMEEERHGLDAEVRRLRGEIDQRESKTAESFWQRTVAADREKLRLEAELDQAQAKVATLTSEKSELEAELLPVQSEAASYRFQFNEADKVASRVLAAEEGQRFSNTQLEVMKTEFAATSAQLSAVQTELAQQKAGARKQLEEKERKAGDDVASLRTEMRRLQEAICCQADRVVAASTPVQAVAAEGNERALTPLQGPDVAALVSSEAARIRQEELSRLTTELELERDRNATLQRLLEEGEEARRRMHNTIQDLRGSVRVYVRARPFLQSDGEDASQQSAAVVRCGADACSVAVIPPDAPNRAISCAFDHVFGGHASQEDVFKEVSGFVQSALDGFKVCLFSYGQTGSGKTHTMTGSGTGMMRGIVPRAVEHILEKVADLQDGQWSYTVQASFLEIYNEEIKDLLVGYGIVGDGAKTRTGNGGAGAKLGIKKAADGGTEVVGLTKFAIDTDDREQGLEQLEEIMGVAQRSRSVASTAMNAQSSRSHSVFTLWLTGADASTGTTLRGVLHLVDLAGSERLDRSGVGNDAQRLKETQSINKSLSCLADVFSSLSAKASHIPFRNSKLTYLMQDCLSGDGKALMFVNLSPTAASASETVCSLRFANQVSQVELGKATRRISLSKPPAIRAGRPPSSGNSPTRPPSVRATRASGSGASSASTAPLSPRTSNGSNGGSFGWGRASVTSRPSSSSALTIAGGNNGRSRRSSACTSGPPSPARSCKGSPARGPGKGSPAQGTGKGSPAKGTRGSVGGRTGGISSSSRLTAPTASSRVKGATGSTFTTSVRGSIGGGGLGGGGSRLSSARATRLSVDSQRRKEVVRKSRGAERAPGGRQSFSGSVRPSSAISRMEGGSVSPRPGAAGMKRPRFSAS